MARKGYGNISAAITFTPNSHSFTQLPFALAEKVSYERKEKRKLSAQSFLPG